MFINQVNKDTSKDVNSSYCFNWDILSLREYIYYTKFVQVLESFGKFWKVMEIDSAIFQNLEIWYSFVS